MPDRIRSISEENVNGLLLTLKIESENGAPSFKKFTITYRIPDSECTMSNTYLKIALIMTILVNIYAMWFVLVSLTATIALLIVLISSLIFWLRHSIQSEIVLITPTVGIQSTVKYVYGREDYFVPWNLIDDVIINEVIEMNRVLYYVTLLVKNQDLVNGDIGKTKLIPLFKFTRPKLSMLQVIYSEIQTLLTPREKLPPTGSGDTG